VYILGFILLYDARNQDLLTNAKKSSSPSKHL
jgi:hypothetical protein